MFAHRARGQAKTGTIVLLSVLVVAIAGVWFWQMRPPADAAVIAKQGDKLQCPMCKKFEANWGMAPDSPSGSGVLMP
jgi:hypothetical protein